MSTKITRGLFVSALIAAIITTLVSPIANAVDARASATLNALLRASQDAEASLTRQLELDKSLPPERRTDQRYFACVANALDRYSAQLQALAPSLPPDLQNLPSIVAETARRVRSAGDPKEASAAIHDAVSQVRKAIALIRAEDPDAGIARREVTSVSQTFNFMDVKLLKATEI